MTVIYSEAAAVGVRRHQTVRTPMSRNSDLTSFDMSQRTRASHLSINMHSLAPSPNLRTFGRNSSDFDLPSTPITLPLHQHQRSTPSPITAASYKPCPSPVTAASYKSSLPVSSPTTGHNLQPEVTVSLSHSKESLNSSPISVLRKNTEKSIIPASKSPTNIETSFND